MEIKIDTKFNIGQKVYTCYNDTYFKNGRFHKSFAPNTEPKVIDKILITQEQGENNYTISYSCKGTVLCYPEDRVFETLEKAQQWCNNYE